MKTVFRFVSVVSGVCLFLQTGCEKPQGKVAEKPAATNAAVLEMNLANDLPLVPDPASRPLPVSKPAAHGRDWIVQTLMQGYRDTGQTNALWNQDVERAFESYADLIYGKAASAAKVDQAAGAAVAAGCKDPMVSYLSIRYQERGKVGFQDALKAHDAMLRSVYHPRFKFSAGYHAVSLGYDRGKVLTRTPQLDWVTVSLEDFARDTNAPVNDIVAEAHRWLEFLNTKEWREYVGRDLEKIIETNWSKTEPGCYFLAERQIDKAWDARGRGFADKVTDAGWQGFADHLNRAESYATKAWEKNKNRASTAYLMMRVELGQGRGRQREEMWFKRAMALDTNYYSAAIQMAFYLEPRWYGSDAACLAFARTCVTSTNWGGRVPLVLADTHRSLANYYRLSNSPAYWHRPTVVADVKASYEKFFKLNPDAVGWRHNYARDAFNCGQYVVFLKQVQLFEGTNHSFFGGVDKFGEMLQKAAAEAQGNPK